ncbi:MAG: helix-turn-helix transcriptional regulator [Oscillospiraceae bacterium]|nr:helix-turn-helix transcriptional regulator [Oscillospiraceae bacterium]
MELITERLNAVVDALEQSLTDKPDKGELSRIARCSYSDLNSLFLQLTGVTVAEYARKRRLTLAGIELKYRDAKVLDTALKYGYDSPVSFARAFQSFHGFNPNAARREDCVLRNTPRLHFSISVKGVMNMIRTDKITIDGRNTRRVISAKRICPRGRTSIKNAPSGGLRAPMTISRIALKQESSCLTTITPRWTFRPVRSL